MDEKSIVEFILSSIINRKEIFDISIDRGLGKGMQIEKWILVEMLSKLMILKNNKKIEKIEGEHDYLKLKRLDQKRKKYEQCDLWWKTNNEEHWLEVKTIVTLNKNQRGTLKNIKKDLDKVNRLLSSHIFHHLTFLFPVEEDKIDNWKRELLELYKNNNFFFKNEWCYNLWKDKSLLISLYTYNNR